MTVRFAGDSGDGMQVTGGQFTTPPPCSATTSTFPDFPAEIRAPTGTLPGVSGFQIQFSEHRHPHARRLARRARRDEPGRAQGEPEGPRAGRDDRRQREQLHRGQPQEGRLRHEPARGRHALALPRGEGPPLRPDARAPSRARASTRPRSSAARTSSRSASCSGSTTARARRHDPVHQRQKFRKKARVLADANIKVLQAGWSTSPRPASSSRPTTGSKATHLPPGHLPQHQRQRGDRPRPRRRRRKKARGRTSSTAATRSPRRPTSSTT
jgi:hypothetical protein